MTQLGHSACLRFQPKGDVRRVGGTAIRYLEIAGAPELRNRFFRLWTRKEAALKALGLGGVGDISVVGDLLAAQGANGRAMNIALRSLPGPPGHALALAIEAPG